MNNVYYKVGKRAFELVNELRSFDSEDTIESWDNLDKERQISMYKFIDDVLKNPDMSPEDMHISWMNERLSKGWVYGEVTDRFKKTHNCLIPYKELSVLQKAKDAIVIRVVNQHRKELQQQHCYLVWFKIIDEQYNVLVDSLQLLKLKKKILDIKDVRTIELSLLSDTIQAIKKDDFFDGTNYNKLKINITNTVYLGVDEDE